MASSPRGQHELDFEAEEAAILAAVGETNVDLVVDDTGDPEQLARRLAAAGGMPAVHLSCHGLNNWRPRPGAPGVPVLLMENELGEGRPTTVADLVRLLTVVPRLLLISACLTATGADNRWKPWRGLDCSTPMRSGRSSWRTFMPPGAPVWRELRRPRHRRRRRLACAGAWTTQYGPA